MLRIKKAYLLAVAFSVILFILGTGLTRTGMRTLSQNEVMTLCGGEQGPWEEGKGAIKDAPTGCESTPTSEDCAHRESCTGTEIQNTYTRTIYYNDGTSGWCVSFNINQCAIEYLCTHDLLGRCTYNEYEGSQPIKKPTGYMEHPTS